MFSETGSPLKYPSTISCLLIWSMSDRGRVESSWLGFKDMVVWAVGANKVHDKFMQNQIGILFQLG